MLSFCYTHEAPISVICRFTYDGQTNKMLGPYNSFRQDSLSNHICVGVYLWCWLSQAMPFYENQTWWHSFKILLKFVLYIASRSRLDRVVGRMQHWVRYLHILRTFRSLDFSYAEINKIQTSAENTQRFVGMVSDRGFLVLLQPLETYFKPMTRRNRHAGHHL